MNIIRKEDALETIAFLKYFGSVKRFGMNLMFLTKSQKESTFFLLTR